ncbi:uncharacterized protein LOC119374767 [Rhipicephalus sanguineus]|uniref:uncharacterized protein LOC119374767 n=1 Tax=Rhipicephalus sanguineus TaxID=34632 RepID=UPI0020C2D443|nr:uncharacterized protein LOC119374767 [Rhipicephalus sanguineus]
MSIVSVYQEHYKCSLATSLLPFSADVNDMPEGSSGRSSPHIASVPSSQRAGGSSSHGDTQTSYSHSPHELPDNSDTQTSSSDSPHELPDKCFKKHVLRLLNILRFTQQHHGDLLQNLCDQSARQPLTSSPPLIERPFNSVDDLMHFDAKLDKEKTESLVREFIDLGGRNVSAATKRILAYTFCDDLASLFSWMGRKGKLNFSTLKTAAAIVVAVKRATQGNTNEIEDTSKLRHAPKRAGNCKKQSAEVFLPQE